MSKHTAQIITITATIILIWIWSGGYYWLPAWITTIIH